MEFPHELKELYPDKIIEVRGNAEALTVILNKDVDIQKLSREFERKFHDLNEPMTLFLKHEDKQDFEKLVLKA
ncbi:hypothetical protein [Pedobacter rhizosphaerae]|jgi:hypothetical protein|uniref:Uncharacterized protein n=1 Tax=Pedobacter rhizosphaerae TaxID=390241 RepID=A0A1H9K4U4_9SPHI|nr:hypothetical protein [Pedobacter rhizosphaerae]SEQ93923.1 hypothetical protein SAMN04488023_102211 [Pedobacter rhizosphaerae]